MKLDIGCGDHKKQKYLGFDKHDFTSCYELGTFIQHDMKDRLPVEDGTVDEIWCNHMLEHLPPRHPTEDIDYLVWVMNEFYRVLKVGGKAHCIVPWCNHPNNRRSPGHYRSFNEWSFQWWTYSGKSMPGEMAANQRHGRWGAEKNCIHDNTHIYAIMIKLEEYP